MSVRLLRRGGAKRDIVQILFDDLTHAVFDPADAQNVWEMRTTGRVWHNGVGGPLADQYAWVTPEANASLYEMRWYLIAGTGEPVVTPGAQGVWLPLNVNRGFTNERLTVGSTIKIVRVDVRKIGGLAILASNNVSFEAEVS